MLLNYLILNVFTSTYWSGNAQELNDLGQNLKGIEVGTSGTILQLGVFLLRFKLQGEQIEDVDRRY